MKVKLTLLLDNEAIKKGKVFAKQNNTSLSRLVQQYLLLIGEQSAVVETVPVSAKLQSMLGIGFGSHSETDYYEHLAQKHV